MQRTEPTSGYGVFVCAECGDALEEGLALRRALRVTPDPRFEETVEAAQIRTELWNLGNYLRVTEAPDYPQVRRVAAMLSAAQEKATPLAIPAHVERRGQKAAVGY